MLEQAKELFRKYNISGIKLYQGDIGKLPFEQEYFDIILSMIEIGRASCRERV